MSGANQAYRIPSISGLFPLMTVASEKGLPFEVKAPNAATAGAMKEARNGGLPSFRNVSSLMADLNAED
jgi:DNA-damage-inducible protein J